MALAVSSPLAPGILVLAALSLIVGACASGAQPGAQTDETLANGASSSLAPSSPSVEPAPGPALWRIADEDTTLYLFGAADALPPEAPWRSPALRAAFESADAIILETDESAEAQAALGPVIQSIGLFQNGETLTSLLTTAQADEIGTVTRAYGAPLAALDPLKPWLAAIQIGALNAARQGYGTWQSGLMQLGADAKAAGKPVSYLEENRAVLLNVINALPRETHINMLIAAARGARDRPTDVARAADLYLAGDIDALAALYHGEGRWADDILYDALLVERNRAWSATIEEALAEETGVVFFAVGVGHVLGADRLQAMLEAKGLAVTRL